MELIQLTSEYEMKPFDCGDAALNGFLRNEAKLFLENRLAKTYLLCDDEQIVGYFCLLNDKLSKQEMANIMLKDLIQILGLRLLMIV